MVPAREDVPAYHVREHIMQCTPFARLPDCAVQAEHGMANTCAWRWTHSGEAMASTVWSRAEPSTCVIAGTRSRAFSATEAVRDMYGEPAVEVGSPSNQSDACSARTDGASGRY